MQVVAVNTHMPAGFTSLGTIIMELGGNSLYTRSYTVLPAALRRRRGLTAVAESNYIWKSV